MKIDRIRYSPKNFLSFGSPDGHVIRDARDLSVVSDRTLDALSIDTNRLSLCRLVAEQKPFELGAELLFSPTSKSHKSKTKPKFKNPARENLDIVPYIDNPLSIPTSLNKWRRR